MKQCQSESSPSAGGDGDTSLEYTSGSMHTSPLSNIIIISPALNDDSEDDKVNKKWFFTFEQFVPGIQQKPELCQFFAEQSVMDLAETSRTSVDLVLSS